jgi:predicted phosphodiesterase
VDASYTLSATSWSTAPPNLVQRGEQDFVLIAGSAPVAAIRGNNDRDTWAKELPEVLKLQIGSVVLRVIHDVNDMKAEVGQSINAVVSGHSHKPSLIERDGTLFINPGSAGPRRFKLPVAVGKLQIIHGKIQAQIIELII